MTESSNVNELVSSCNKEEWEELYLEHARGERNDLLPFPSPEVQRITNARKGEDTAKHAISILDCVLSCVQDIRPIHRNMTILDFGCGWGRITRLLPFFFDLEGISGSDANKELIDSANEKTPFIKHFHNESLKPLPFATSTFDIIFANSVFSHLSKKACLFYLDELYRIMKTKGVLVFSVLQEEHMNRFYNSPNQKKWIEGVMGSYSKASSMLDRDGFSWGDTKRWPEYGIAVMTDEWIKKALDETSLNYVFAKKGNHPDTQDYKVCTKT